MCTLLYVCYILVTFLKDVGSFLNLIKIDSLKTFLSLCVQGLEKPINDTRFVHHVCSAVSLRKFRLTQYDGQAVSRAPHRQGWEWSGVGLPLWDHGISHPHGHTEGTWVKPAADTSPTDPGPRPSPSQATHPHWARLSQTSCPPTHCCPLCE